MVERKRMDLSVGRISEIIEKNIKVKEAELRSLMSSLIECCMKDVMNESGLLPVEIITSDWLTISSAINSEIHFMYVDMDMKKGFEMIREFPKKNENKIFETINELQQEPSDYINSDIKLSFEEWKEKNYGKSFQCGYDDDGVCDGTCDGCLQGDYTDYLNEI